jgi:hypothetical protein
MRAGWKAGCLAVVLLFLGCSEDSGPGTSEAMLDLSGAWVGELDSFCGIEGHDSQCRLSLQQSNGILTGKYWDACDGDTLPLLSGEAYGGDSVGMRIELPYPDVFLRLTGAAVDGGLKGRWMVYVGGAAASVGPWHMRRSLSGPRSAR